MANKDVAQKEQYNWRNFSICFLVSMGQLAFGYPASIIGTTLGEPSFLIYMNLIDADGLTAKGAQLVGAMSGVFQAGAFFGVLAASWVMDRYGRKAGMMYCAFFSLVGGALLTAANGDAMFITARFLVSSTSQARTTWQKIADVFDIGRHWQLGLSGS